MTTSSTRLPAAAAIGEALETALRALHRRLAKRNAATTPFDPENVLKQFGRWIAVPLLDSERPLFEDAARLAWPVFAQRAAAAANPKVVGECVFALGNLRQAVARGAVDAPEAAFGIETWLRMHAMQPGTLGDYARETCRRLQLTWPDGKAAEAPNAVRHDDETVAEAVAPLPAVVALRNELTTVLADLAPSRTVVCKAFQQLLVRIVGTVYTHREECRAYCAAITETAAMLGLQLQYQGHAIILDSGLPRTGSWNVRLRHREPGPLYKTHLASSISFPPLECQPLPKRP